MSFTQHTRLLLPLRAVGNLVPSEKRTGFILKYGIFMLPLIAKIRGRTVLEKTHIDCELRFLRTTFRNIGFTSVLTHKEWRLANGYSYHWNNRGVLTDSPDYSYEDGRTTPYTNGQRVRLIRHKQYAEKILYLLKAVDYAKNKYQHKMQAVEEKKQSILDRKLKPKGNLLKTKIVQS